MDDTYIHFTYAKNLAEGRGLYFSFQDERGVGTSSFLWVLILAGGIRAGVSIHLLAKMIGVLSLLCTSIGIYQLMKAILHNAAAFLGALLVGMSGNMLWFALSGMETMLFVALGISSLLVYRNKKWITLGFLLGLLVLTRPEGILLTLAIVVIEFIQERKISREILIITGVCLLIASPWYAYLFLRTGHFLPTSAVGKQLSHRVAMLFVLDSRPGMSWLGNFPSLIYLGSWLVYLFEFTLGGIALPAPHIPLASLGGGLTYSFSVWAIASWMLAAFLIWAAFRRCLKPASWRSWLTNSALRTWIVFLLWAVFHNIVYMIWMPVPGTASRYGAINHVLLWSSLIVGLSGFKDRLRSFRVMLIGVFLIAGVNTCYWDEVYEANLEHMQEVRIRAARYLSEVFSEDELCAASDVGALRYFSNRPIIDMGALVNPEAGQWFLRGEADQYLLDHGATCLVVPGRMKNAGEGLLDIVTIMGLSSSRDLQLTEQKVFEIDQDRWLLGYLPTNNYQASVVLYRLTPTGLKSE